MLPTILAACVIAGAPAPQPLSFAEMYVTPVGAGGLRPTPRFLALANTCVRVTGAMVRREDGTAGRGVFLLSPVAVALADDDDGDANDLPASAITVVMPATAAARAVAWRAGRVDVVGRLQLGALRGADGRISHARLVLDDAEALPFLLSPELR